MAKRLRGLTVLIGLLVLGASLILGGCSAKSSTSPQASGLDGLTTLNRAIGEPVLEATKVFEPEVTDSISIVKNTYCHKFRVPAKALDAATAINMKTFKALANGKNVIVFEFGPEGLVFRAPTNLDIDMNEINPLAKSANLYYFDPLADSWIYQGSVSVANGRASFKVYHFSKYAIDE